MSSDELWTDRCTVAGKWLLGQCWTHCARCPTSPTTSRPSSPSSPASLRTLVSCTFATKHFNRTSLKLIRKSGIFSPDEKLCELVWSNCLELWVWERESAGRRYPISPLNHSINRIRQTYTFTPKTDRLLLFCCCSFSPTALKKMSPEF